jgi:hypothetical protein
MVETLAALAAIDMLNTLEQRRPCSTSINDRQC